MTVPGKRRPSSAKRRRASHFALKPKQLITVDGKKVPHGLKKAYTRTKAAKAAK